MNNKLTPYGQEIIDVFVQKCTDNGIYQVYERYANNTSILLCSVETIEHFAAWFLLTYDGWGALKTLAEQQAAIGANANTAFHFNPKTNVTITFGELQRTLEKCVI